VCELDGETLKSRLLAYLCSSQCKISGIAVAELTGSSSKSQKHIDHRLQLVSLRVSECFRELLPNGVHLPFEIASLIASYASCEVEMVRFPPSPPGLWTLLARQTARVGPWPKEPHDRRRQLTKNVDNPSSETYANFARLDEFRRPWDGRNATFEFLLRWPGTQGLWDAGYGGADGKTFAIDGKDYNHWRQSSNPFVSVSAVTGYEALDVPYTGNNWGGLLNGADLALLIGSTNNGWWWYAVGSYQMHTYAKIPGPNRSDRHHGAGLCADVVELWVRSG